MAGEGIVEGEKGAVEGKKNRRERFFRQAPSSFFDFFPSFVRPLNLFSHPPSTTNQQQQGHLLKDQLEVVKVPPADGVGRPRYTIKPIEDELPFDKVP